MGSRDDEITIRMTGCPNGCARPYIAEIGLVGKGPGRYNLYLGACLRRLAALEALRGGRRSTTASSQPSIRSSKPMRTNAAPDERFGDFVIRAGYVAKTANGADFHANTGPRKGATLEARP